MLALTGAGALAVAAWLWWRGRRTDRLAAWRRGTPRPRAGLPRPRLPWRRRGPDPRDALVEILDELATALEAGLPAGRAVVIVLESHGPPAWAGPLLTDAEAGRRLAHAWADAEAHVPVGDLARAWALSERTGAPLADAVRTAAEVLRARTRVDRRRDATTAGARVTMNLLTTLPAFGLVVILAMGLDPLEVYGNVAGLVCLWVGGVLLLLGRVTVGRLIAAATRGTPA